MSSMVEDLFSVKGEFFVLGVELWSRVGNVLLFKGRDCVEIVHGLSEIVLKLNFWGAVFEEFICYSWGVLLEYLLGLTSIMTHLLIGCNSHVQQGVGLGVVKVTSEPPSYLNLSQTKIHKVSSASCKL